MANLKIGIIGNPNCGKSTIFNELTGSKQQVGNWPGVTVEQKLGYFEHRGTSVTLIDLPGVYSLDTSGSPDEKVALNFLLEQEYDLIINVLDASNLARNLYLTLQLLEMRIPVVLAFNMMDVARKKSYSLDSKKLSEILGIKSVELIARKKIGITELKDLCIKAAREEFPYQLDYYNSLKTATDRVAEKISDNCPYNKNWVALKLLEEAELGIEETEARHIAQECKTQLEEQFDEEPELIIASARHDFIKSIVNSTQSTIKTGRANITDILDNIFLNRIIGIPIFLFIMYLMFTFSITVGGVFQNFFELISEAVFIEAPKLLLDKVEAPEWVSIIIAEGIGGGIRTVAAFIPIIGTMYIFLSFLEDSGYMSRAAFIMDRLMKYIGLPGKAFVPLIVGFGCNVPSIMATRTLESEPDRITTAMMAPFMSCGARLSVYALFCAAFFGSSGQNIVFSLYLIGILVALATGLFVKKFLLPESSSYFIIELPEYHAPSLKAILYKAYFRLSSFIWRAGKLIVLVFLCLHLLNSVSIDGSFGKTSSQDSALAYTGKAITKFFKPIGITEDNWPATVGIFTGIFAKEVVVGSLSALYLAEDSDQGELDISIAERVVQAFDSVYINLLDLYNRITTPLWLNISEMDVQNELLEEQGVSNQVITQIQAKFHGKIGAFAYLLFILLYFPCVSAFAAIYREINLAWALFSAFWSTFIAYIIAALFYQGAVWYYYGYNTSITLLSLIAFLTASLVMITAIAKNYNKQRNT